MFQVASGKRSLKRKLPVQHMKGYCAALYRAPPHFTLVAT